VTSCKIALIPGDGIGTAVTDATWEVLTKAAASAGFSTARASPGPATSTKSTEITAAILAALN
jgi:isocitrate/isopropylmalate dehydrogenase